MTLGDTRDDTSTKGKEEEADEIPFSQHLLNFIHRVQGVVTYILAGSVGIGVAILVVSLLGKRSAGKKTRRSQKPSTYSRTRAVLVFLGIMLAFALLGYGLVIWALYRTEGYRSVEDASALFVGTLLGLAAVLGAHLYERRSTAMSTREDERVPLEPYLLAVYTLVVIAFTLVPYTIWSGL